jgi:hypothetical protein
VDTPLARAADAVRGAERQAAESIPFGLVRDPDEGKFAGEPPEHRDDAPAVSLAPAAPVTSVRLCAPANCAGEGGEGAGGAASGRFATCEVVK